MNLQSAIQFLYPPQCLSCREDTSLDFALCGACWRETSFITGLVCDACGTPLPGQEENGLIHCDTCIQSPPAWGKGRAALLYNGVARRLVLALKHGDHQEMVAPMVSWLAGCVGDLVVKTTVIAPVPLHPRRLFIRRFNQSALLAGKLAKEMNLSFSPDLILRQKSTRIQDGLSREERFENQHGAFQIHPERQGIMQNKPVLLIDDVMTTGATLSACAKVCLAAGATSVNIAVLARVARDP